MQTILHKFSKNFLKTACVWYNKSVKSRWGGIALRAVIKRGKVTAKFPPPCKTEEVFL